MAMSCMPSSECKRSAGDLVGDGAVLAPPWHTLALVTVIVAVAVTGTALGASQTTTAVSEGASRFLAYPALLAVQWGSLFYVCRAFRARSALGALLGRGWNDARRALGDAVLALALFASIVAIEWAWTRFLPGGRPSTSPLLPTTGVELAAWLVVASSTGFCEEVVYRGYLQTQFAAFTRRTWAGVAVQAALFGIAHADQGADAMARVTVYAALLGWVAARRRSLMPCIVAHIGIDLAAAM